MKNYETEARDRWGNTDAYREYKEKGKSYIEQKYDAVNAGMMAIFDEFHACKESGADAGSAEALSDTNIMAESGCRKTALFIRYSFPFCEM